MKLNALIYTGCYAGLSAVFAWGAKNVFDLSMQQVIGIWQMCFAFFCMLDFLFRKS